MLELFFKKMGSDSDFLDYKLLSLFKEKKETDFQKQNKAGECIISYII